MRDEFERLVDRFRNTGLRTLPTTVDPLKAATYQDGIMTSRLPNAEPTAKARILIK